MFRRNFMKLAGVALMAPLLTPLVKLFGRKSADRFPYVYGYTYSGSYIQDGFRWDVLTRPMSPVRKLWVKHPNGLFRIEVLNSKFFDVEFVDVVEIEGVLKYREDGRRMILSTRALPNQKVLGIEHPAHEGIDPVNPEPQSFAQLGIEHPMCEGIDPVNPEPHGYVQLAVEPKRMPSTKKMADNSVLLFYFRTFRTPERIEHRKES